MKGFIRKTIVVVFCSALGFSIAVADSVDNHINNLKNENPEIRAKAAYELGCG